MLQKIKRSFTDKSFVVQEKNEWDLQAKYNIGKKAEDEGIESLESLYQKH